MADKKISQLSPASTPLAGTEVLPIVQSGATVKVASDDLTVKNIRSNATTGLLQVAGPGTGTTRVMTTPNANFTAARTDAAQTFTGDQTFSTVLGTTFDTNVAAAGVTLSGTTLSADGTNTNIDINVTPKGTGVLKTTQLFASGTNGVEVDAGPGSGGYAGRISQSTAFPDTITNIDSIASTSYTGQIRLRTSSNGGALGNRLEIFNSGNVIVSNGTFVVGNGFGDSYATRVSTSVGFPYSTTYIDSFASTSYIGQIVFRTNNNNGALGERLLINNDGNVVCNNAAVATTATDGFLYVATCAGVPTGTPTSYTGRAPIVIDTTNHRLYFYSGGSWRNAGP